MSKCAACRNTETDDVTFHRFPESEEQRDQWIISMMGSEGWMPSQVSALCSEHFTPECFDPSGHLQPDAIPTIFNSPVKESEQPEDHEIESPPSSRSAAPCDCEKRLALMEKSYRLKLLTLQLQVKKYQMELNEQSRHMVKLKRKVIVLQAAAKVLGMRKTSISKKSARTPPEHD